MDAAIFQILIDEFDPNCSLNNAWQDNFFESASFSFVDFDGLYCNATTDQIGTCWPKSNVGQLVERPCPEFFNGVKYNSTRWVYQKCTTVVLFAQHANS
ncbi:Corticotropin-releasing factor receptor 2 [Acipenser ruthenus]|uniref:Corticotropin-releasing factor receptor 2 n=1 Tax=Acipenser ruthenus TaxID=7906 RepID=A0A444U3V1_ACIRT|nr:Corticotropin-releasing factor receptor 2 [Acipenser ruthenus]